MVIETMASLDVKVAVVEDVVVIAWDDAGHPISAPRWLVPVDFVLVVFVHSFHVFALSVSKLLLHGALVGECESGEIGLHGRR